MLTIYNCVSKIKVLSGEHYHKSSMTYTFINDLAKVARQLPRVLDKDIIAILRHEKEKVIIDY